MAQDIWTKWKKKGSTENLPRTGCPKKTTECMEHYIIQESLASRPLVANGSHSVRLWMLQVPKLAPAPSETFSGGKGTIVVSQRRFRISHRPIKGQDLHGHEFAKHSQSRIGRRRFGLTSVMCTLETIEEGSSSHGAQVKNFVMIAVSRSLPSLRYVSWSRQASWMAEKGRWLF